MNAIRGLIYLDIVDEVKRIFFNRKTNLRTNMTDGFKIEKFARFEHKFSVQFPCEFWVFVNNVCAKIDIWEMCLQKSIVYQKLLRCEKIPNKSIYFINIFWLKAKHNRQLTHI